MSKLKPVVFLDRDGTINIERGYIRQVQNLELIENAGLAIKQLNDHNILTVLTSNQTGAARNYYPLQHIYDLHSRLANLLDEQNAHLDLYLFCPHLENSDNPEFSINCNCRKPNTGMLEQAYTQYLDYAKNLCYVIGDKPCDLEFAYNWRKKLITDFKFSSQDIFVKAILVKTGYGIDTLKWAQTADFKPDFIAPSLLEACEFIIGDLKTLE